MNRIIVVSDGSADHKDRAGWGYVYQNGSKKEANGSLSRATSAQSELYAALKGLQSVPDGEAVELKTDCRTVLHVIKKGGGKHDKFHRLFVKEIDRLGEVKATLVPRREINRAHVLANRARKQR